MENITEALLMAGSVLLFVVALSVVVLAFSQVVPAFDAIMSHSDREAMTIQGDARFYYIPEAHRTNRIVGKETIIPTIYRAYKENYKIVFNFPSGYHLFNDKNGNPVDTIDLKKQNIPNDLGSRQFLNGIIYGDFVYEPGKTKTDYEKHFGIDMNYVPLFDYIQDYGPNIKEDLGTYYEEDLGTDIPMVEEINKTEKRVITYTFQ